MHKYNITYKHRYRCMHIHLGNIMCKNVFTQKYNKLIKMVSYVLDK